MAKQTVFLLGASGGTGTSIMDGLLESKQFNLIALIRSSSLEKPLVSDLKAKGVEIRVGDATDSVDSLVEVLKGVDIVISAIDAGSQLAQINLIDAVKKVGNVTRFIPCGWITICPPGGVFLVRDDKEVVYTHMRLLGIPYTIIDVGYWYQASFPSLPSGRVEYASVFRSKNYDVDGNPDQKTALIDRSDIGKFVARVIVDERTLNKSILCYGDVLSQNEIFQLLEEKSGEVIPKNFISAEELKTAITTFKAKLVADPKDFMSYMMCLKNQYAYSKFVRGDNTPEFAKYLGYLNWKDLYPDFKPRAFKDFVDELVEGKLPAVGKLI